MKLKVLLLLFIIINSILPSYAMLTRWYSKILPVTLYEDTWYGLFGHDAAVKDMNQGWTDFSQSAIWGWYDPVSMAVSALNEQTNNRFVLVNKNLEKYAMGLKLGRDLMYFYYYQIPQSTSLNKFQDDLTKESYKSGAYKKINAYAWVPLEKILNNEKIKISLPAREDDEENSLKINNLTINEDVKNILQNNWNDNVIPELGTVLKEQGIFIGPGEIEETETEEEDVSTEEEIFLKKQGSLTNSLSLLQEKLSNLKQLLFDQEEKETEEGILKYFKNFW
jgi:hypothetical protein